MFQTVAIVALLLTVIGIAVHWLLTPLGGPRCPVTGGIHVFSLLLIEQKSSLLGALKKLVYILAVICFVVLAFTGFWPVLVRGEHISGYMMMIHATFAPIFALCLAILAITWAGNHRFAGDDCPWVRRILRRFTSLRVPADERPWRCSLVVHKLTFWAILFLALPLILSIVVSMYPLLGTGWQHRTLALHRWSSLAFTIAVMIHTYLAIRLRMAHQAGWVAGPAYPQQGTGLERA
jgi:cytochrome b subunit of formate dehydrogenase